jgi:putative iron-dependent peroxidase
MKNTQPGILTSVPRLARYLIFSLKLDSDPKKALTELRQVTDGDKVVVGLGKSLTLAVGVDIAGLRSFPNYAGAGVEIPSTPFSLWCWLRGEDRGELVNQTRLIRSTLARAFHLKNVIDAFQYGPSLDLTGYEDGTENPKGDDAVAAAIVKGTGAGMDGSSFVAVQQWVHDLDYFESMSQQKQDNTIGRRKSRASFGACKENGARKLSAGCICSPAFNALGRRNQRRLGVCCIWKEFRRI